MSEIVARAEIRLPFPQGDGIALTAGNHASYLIVEGRGEDEESARARLRELLDQIRTSVAAGARG